ncbi:hypothetical protein [Dolichospermum circinale]|nr:hypothetical protein [Dolichospermum circinale]
MATPAAGIALYPPEAIAHITLPFYVKSQITEAIPILPNLRTMATPAVFYLHSSPITEE